MEPADSASERGTRRARNRAQIPAFGHWDLDHDQVPITQYFECCTRPTPPYSAAASASVYPSCAAYCSNSGYVGDGFLNMFATEGEFHGLCDAVIQQQQLDYYSREHLAPPPHFGNMQARVERVNEQRGTRRQRRRRLYSDNSKKVFDATQATPADGWSEPNDAALDPDLYDVVTSDNFHNGELRNKKKKTSVGAKDEDLYKIPPELIRRSKRGEVVFGEMFRSDLRILASDDNGAIKQALTYPARLWRSFRSLIVEE